MHCGRIIAAVFIGVTALLLSKERVDGSSINREVTCPVCGIVFISGNLGVRGELAGWDGADVLSRGNMGNCPGCLYSALDDDFSAISDAEAGELRRTLESGDVALSAQEAEVLRDASRDNQALFVGIIARN